MMDGSELLLETIKIEDGKAQYLEYHQRRVDRSRVQLLNLKDRLDLREYLLDIPQTGTYRCRVIYSDRVHLVEYIPYRYIPRFKYIAVESSIDYRYKYLDRSQIDEIKTLYSNFDDIIFIQNGRVCDTTIANIAILIDDEWLTPKTPLLEGTTRERLIDSGFLKTADIRVKDLKDAKAFAVMNALSGFRVIDKAYIKEERSNESYSIG